MLLKYNFSGKFTKYAWKNAKKPKYANMHKKGFYSLKFIKHDLPIPDHYEYYIYTFLCLFAPYIQRHCQLMCCSVSPGDIVEQLPLDVGQQPWGTNPEQPVVEPGVSQLLLDEDEPSADVLANFNDKKERKAQNVMFICSVF